MKTEYTRRLLVSLTEEDEQNIKIIKGKAPGSDAGIVRAALKIAARVAGMTGENLNAIEEPTADSNDTRQLD